MGIDLGTTNTCVAVIEANKPTVVPNAEGGRTTPSVVAFTPDGNVLVGEPARRQAVTNASGTITSVKRLMGLTRSSGKLAEISRRAAYEIVPDEQGRVMVMANGQLRSPIEISAMILRAVREAAEEYFGDDCSAAVICCPAYFDDTQRAATHDAARVAGLDVLRIINEPTAAALAYSWSRGREGRIAIFDFGGGTFDCSVLDCKQGVVQVLSTRGNSYLGGDDIDAKIVDHLKDGFYRLHGTEIGDDPVAAQRLREAAERAKIELSGVSETEVMLPFLAVDAAGPKHLQTTLTRARLEALVTPLVDEALRCCKQALEDANLAPRDVEEVLLVGGSTKMPYVRKRVEEFFGQATRKGLNPDEAVAIGAAVQAALLEGQTDDVLLMDVLPLSLGIAAGERFAAILRRNQPIPTSRTERFSTVRDFQSSVLLKVYQGDREMARDNRLIGTFRLENLPPARAGQVQIDVTFKVDENGLLDVEGQDARTGLKRTISVRDSMRLSDDEIAALRGRIATPETDL